MGKLLASQSAGVRCGIRVLVVCFLALASGAAQVAGASASKAPSSNHGGKGTSEHLSFVREFSSARDVKRAHPVVDRTLDIIAGPKQDGRAVDILETPYAVTTDSSHRVFVTDIGAKAVHVFDFVHAKYSRLEGSGDLLRRPVGVAADLEGNVYVTDSSSGAILVFDSKGRFRRYLKESKGRESYFEAPMGIAVDAATEHIYVCDPPRHMVIVLDKKGHVLGRFGKRGGGTEPGEFRYPTQLVVAGGELVILDSGNHRVQILDVRGHFRREIKVGYTDDRTGLAVDGDRNIYVTDAMLNRFQVFNHDSQLLYEFGRSGKEAGEFNGASGMWVDPGHCLYVVDARNQRIQAFQIDGQSTNGCL